ncbi:MAG: carotenoid biosynthesis protein, partial [Candidatus Dormibacteria bacterium]
HYRGAGLQQDWRVLGVPVFDTLSFTWLAFCAFSLTGWLGARGWRRIVLADLCVVALDVVVDPVALRGAHWWLGSIYSYPPGSGVWYGVSALNYLGWAVVGAALLLWVRLLVGEGGGEGLTPRWISAVLLAAAMAQSTALAWWLGIGPAALAALGLLALWLLFSRWAAPPAPAFPPRLIVACALATEARALRRSGGRDWRAYPLPPARRWWCPRSPFEVWTSGLGPEAALSLAAAVPAGVPVLVAGLSGACRPGWGTGDLALGRRVRGPDGAWTKLLDPPRPLMAALAEARPADLGTSPAPVGSAAGLADLARQGVELVDTESSSWVTQLPGRVTVLRVVLDTPGELLGAAAGLVPAGSATVDGWALLVLLARHPRAAAKLLRLGLLSGRCLPRLGAALQRIAPLLADSPPALGGDREPSAPNSSGTA